MPAVIPDSSKLRVVKAELERGLQPTRPAFLKWCCDKLSALPTQSSNGVNAALWADNVIDVCGGYPEDVLQSATLELLRSCTFRPSPAEIVKTVEPKHGERKRMLERVNMMLSGVRPKPDTPAEQPIATRLGRLEHTRAIYVRMKRVADIERIDREIAKERGEAVPVASDMGIPVSDERPPFKPSDSPSARRCAELAAARHQKRAPNPTPEWDAVPEAAA